MKRSIFYLLSAVAVMGLSACDKRPMATDEPVPPTSTPTPTSTATPPPVGEKLDPSRPSGPAIEPGKDKKVTPDPADGPLFPGISPGSQPGGSPAVVPPHRKPPVSAKMEV